MGRVYKTVFSFLLLGVAAVCLFLPDGDKTQYYRNEGLIFGTSYTIQYEATTDWHDSIRMALAEVDEALSMFNEQSQLARINRNDTVTTNALFEQVYNAAYDVSALSHGAFDITVAPLVNAWGFGFSHRQQMASERVDSLLALVGYQTVGLNHHHIVKSSPEQMLDAGAVAKGFACDHVARLLHRHEVKNLLVDIGGEVVAKGVNTQHRAWAIGITKPIDDVTGKVQELQDIIHTSDLCMATSGNYRNFYYEGTERRSHTIDPRTGYPVRHGLLSATVTASSCMRADALATCCMVLGADSALSLIETLSDTECYLIEAVPDTDGLQVRTSSGWPTVSEP